MNPRPFEWQSNALPTEPQPHIDPMVSRVIDLLVLHMPKRDSQVYPLEAKTGIEPATCSLQVSCTASCATWPFPIRGLGSGPMGLVLLEPIQIKREVGPGNGNRTRVFCLEGRHSTIELHRDVRLISQPIV